MTIIEEVSSKQLVAPWTRHASFDYSKNQLIRENDRL